MTNRDHQDDRDREPELDWSAVWSLHSRWLRTVLLARLRDRYAVDEVFQEMALIVVRKPQRWPDQSKLGPWLYRVAIRQIQSYRRRQLRAKRRWAAESPIWEPVDPDSVDPVMWLVDREAESQVHEALQRLGDQDREMLLLKHTQHWTYQEIAEHLGISLDKVIYRLARAQRALKSELASRCRDWLEKSMKE